MAEANKEELLRINPNKGTNQVSARSYNERLVLHLVREHGALSKAEATLATGLSANACSVIFRALEAEGLLIRGEPIRGRVGQPSTPLRLNPAAQHYVVLRIGRRSAELSVVNFVGEIVASREQSQAFPTPSSIIDFFDTQLGEILRSAKKTKRDIAAMSVAMPFELWGWSSEFGAPVEEMRAWRDFDVAKELGKKVPWDILIENDATAGCRAELMFGKHQNMQDWIYFFVGTFIGGGVVLNGSVYPGRRGTAGGFGPMRVTEQSGGYRLVDHASLVVLERAIAEAGGNPFDLYADLTDWDRFEPMVGHWIVRAGRNLADAIVSTLSVLDLEGVVIDGALPAKVKRRLVAQVIAQLESTDLQGVQLPIVEDGQLGAEARTKGAAAALISSSYGIDPSTLSLSQM